MKTPFYQILELYEDAVLSHAQHDLTCTETAVIKLDAILNTLREGTMKTPFYLILELYEDAVLSHAHHDLTCTETAVLKLGAILNQFAETRDDVARGFLFSDALNAHQAMLDGIDAWRAAKETQNQIDLSRDQDWWDAHNQRMADLRADYNAQEKGR